MRKISMAAMAAFTVLASSGSVGALAASGPRHSGPDGPLARFEQQKITWNDCRTGPGDELGTQLHAAGARCAEVTVPLDHSRPDGRTITVAISRLQATAPGRRRGALLINPGGPGDPGRIYAPLLKTASPALAARYDLIGMDPRFTGLSTPLNCHWPIGDYVRSTGHDRRAFDRIAAQAEDLAARCAGQREMLPHASARATARDMDVIRAALGESKLSYLGGSYGTYLGAVYMQLFPARVDRFVLDSALDPADAGPGYARSMGPYLAAALKEWAGWAARHHDRYRLGSTPARVLATVDRIDRAAARTPLRIGRHQVDTHVFPAILLLSLGRDSEQAYAALAADLKVLDDAARGAEITSAPSLEEGLAYLSSPETGGAGSARMAITCADGTASRDPGAYYRDIRAHRADEPLFGPLTRAMNLPCAFWPTSPAEPPTRIRNDVPALIVGASGDPKTPHPGQRAMRRALSGSRMVTVRGAFRHLVSRVFTSTPDACVDDAVGRYLLEGVLPAEDTTCPAR
ncbi:alpha/beta fold hydrolase [Planomonospora sp. ID91781]|uniref:alpha/beta hydrolase n=1 Tax=Planomonospora sp. ID91781 TaxID=2738135 RepID=UPI0018C43C44|nr:alpha/beta hydrolase [Planomonospora sp. ID91781]MBG0822498.1 alpha/beta fold hydrolase [Planomonospora sp. ID91781]